ncbi:cryptochrome/photolyase family protein [Mangrovimonas aestuarii]|uniref:cryptochrome/photolyase family protein n=1 Tax=Mangrovimonas aestuarii TaxID=3018443 RepID=UPI002378555A|nr:deoxyribodipyrimidine photo-lyase [Mangrovimonas aestuarii]
MNSPIAIFWFRRDLRLEDNTGLYHALKSGLPILPIFVFDKNILDSLPKKDARVEFIHSNLNQIKSVLETQYQSSLKVLYSTPFECFNSLISNFNIKAVYTNHDYEPYAQKRDQVVKDLLKTKNIDFHSYKDQVIFEKDEIVKSDGDPYKVYTPYMKRWMAQLSSDNTKSFPSENYLDNCTKTDAFDFPALKELGFEVSEHLIKPFDISEFLLNQYEKTRDFPGKDTTSRIGPHLRFGTISIRKVVKRGLKLKNNTFLKELIWREFFMQILWHYPETVTKSFKPQYDTIVWRNDKSEFKKWCEGNTGYPLVDAGMRQLNQTGFMHNRVRMVVGSFLCKHLLIDWRCGEAYFAEKLHDFDLASNVGNWQWVAGCGVDAAPYFRIFNPTTQIDKFDKQHTYIKKWVPEYQELTYPNPMVDHKFARERCLKTYKAALNQN